MLRGERKAVQALFADGSPNELMIRVTDLTEAGATGQSVGKQRSFPHPGDIIVYTSTTGTQQAGKVQRSSFRTFVGHSVQGCHGSAVISALCAKEVVS